MAHSTINKENSAGVCDLTPALSKGEGVAFHDKLFPLPGRGLGKKVELNQITLLAQMAL